MAKYCHTDCRLTKNRALSASAGDRSKKQHKVASVTAILMKVLSKRSIRLVSQTTPQVARLHYWFFAVYCPTYDQVRIRCKGRDSSLRGLRILGRPKKRLRRSLVGMTLKFPWLQFIVLQSRFRSQSLRSCFWSSVNRRARKSTCVRPTRRIEVDVLPDSFESVVDKSNNFLSSSQQVSVTIFAIAKWRCKKT